MIELRAHCKINLGLRVMRLRADGFHDIETVMLPVRGLYDTVSVKALPSDATFVALTPPPYPAPRPVFPTGSVLEVSGTGVDCPPEQNICMKALRLVQREYGIGEAAINLRKAIPSGAGLGGGSADAAAVLRALNEEFVLELTATELEGLAARLGSDVPFFVRAESGERGGAQLCTGRGEIMTPVKVDPAGLRLAIVKPPVAVSTAEAYAGIVPREVGPTHPDTGLSLTEIVRRPVGEWRGLLVNDFEESIFERHPEIAATKRALYEAGAVYASMSGSGSAVFGIFDRRPEGVKGNFGSLFVHTEHIR
jgi:4-diphosphocytidyl-2-C-methyl-D-erythritol kinase